MEKLGEWQPIETAPKDGTFILAYEPQENGDHDPRIAVVQWYQHLWERFEPVEGTDLYEKRVERTEGFWEGGPCSPWRATHWMPLPEPPK